MSSRISQLINKTYHPQRSPEWFRQRMNKISASEAASTLTITKELISSYLVQFPQALKCLPSIGKCANPYSSYEKFLMNKLQPKSRFQGNQATRWGNDYEPVALKFYEIYKGTTVSDVGFIEHETIPFLGASPDGIVGELERLIEIKCPFRREINGILPFYYYIQIQIQLEVCQVDNCDYLECDFQETSDIEEILEMENCLICGYRDMATNKLVIADSVEHLESLQSENLLYFYLNNFFLSTIPRDRDWFAAALPFFQKAYDEWQEQKTKSIDLSEEVKVLSPSPPKDTVDFFF